MRTRVWLAAVSLFWAVMTVWLWRTEFGARRQPGSVPVAMVWNKMLTAPDPSSLEIYYRSNSVGYCHWRPDVVETIIPGENFAEDEPLEGMVQLLSHYSLDFEGAMTLPDFPTRLRFSFRLRLETNQIWETFDATAAMRPDIYELSANAPAQTVRLRVDAGEDQFNRTFTFAELQNPQKLLKQFGGPLFPAMVAAFGVPLTTNQIAPHALGLRWEARNDAILVGQNRLRAYRLQTKLLDRYRITFFISPVGELLRAEFPGDIVLINQALVGLRQTTSHD